LETWRVVWLEARGVSEDPGVLEARGVLVEVA
jgi:hypothetical protein